MIRIFTDFKYVKIFIMQDKFVQELELNEINLSDPSRDGMI